MSLTFWDHVEELRFTLIRCFFIIFLGIVGCFIFSKPLIFFLSQPLESIRTSRSVDLQRMELKREKISNFHSRSPQKFQIPSHAEILYLSEGIEEVAKNVFLLPPDTFMIIEEVINPLQLIILSPYEGMLITCKISIWGGILFTSPIWLFLILQFIAPALGSLQKSFIFLFLFLSLIFLGMGIFLGFSLIIPLANGYLYYFNESLGSNVWSLAFYMDYSLHFLIATALIFEGCLITLFLVHYRLISIETLCSKRRYVILGAFIVGAVFSPPDVLSQVLLATPMIVLYELAIIYGRIKKSVGEYESIVSEII